MSSLRKKGVNAFLWDFIGKIANHGVSFIISIILARLLAPEDFGLIAMVNVILVMATILMDVGLGKALVQRKRNLPIHYSSVFYFNFSIGLLLTLTLYLSADYISLFYGKPELVLITKVMSFSFVISSLAVVQNAILTKKLNFKKITTLKLTSASISGIIGVVLAYKGYGVWSLVIQLIIGRILYVILIWSVAKWNPGIKFSIKALKLLWGYGFRMFLAQVLDTIFVKIDVLIIGKIFDSSSLGYYQRAKSLDQMVIQYTSGSMMQVLFPLFSQIQTDLNRLKELVLKALHALSIVTFALLGVLYLCAEEVIVILFTDKWLVSVEYFKILLLSGYIYPFSSLLINIISSRGNSKDFLKLSILKKIMVGFNLIFGFYFGISGFLYGFALVRLVSMSLNIYFAGKELKTPFFWFLKPIIPNILFSVSLVVLINTLLYFYPISNIYLSLIIKGTLFCISYIGLSFLFKLKGLNFLFSLLK